MKQQINFNKIARKIRHKRQRLEKNTMIEGALFAANMTPQWRKVMENDIRRLQLSGGRIVYFHEPRPYNGLRKRMVPAVAMPDGTYIPAW